MNTTPPSSSTPPKRWPRWLAHVAHKSSQQSRRRQLSAPNLRAAEESAIALVAFDLRADPQCLTVIRLRQLNS